MASQTVPDFYWTADLSLQVAGCRIDLGHIESNGFERLGQVRYVFMMRFSFGSEYKITPGVLRLKYDSRGSLSSAATDAVDMFCPAASSLRKKKSYPDMPAWSINNTAKAPLLIMATVEFAILFSSIYIGGIVAFGGITATESSVGPIVPRAIFVSSVVFVSMIAMGLYQFHQRMWFSESALRVLAGVFGGVVFAVVMNLVLPRPVISQEMAFVVIGYSIPLLLLVRYFFVRTIDQNVFRRRTLIYGDGERAASIADLRRKADRRGFQIVARVSPKSDVETLGESARLSSRSYLSEVVRRTQPDEIVVAVDDRRGNLPIRELLDARLKGVEVIDLMEFLERETAKIRVDLVNPGWLIFSSGFRQSRLRRYAKRLIDLGVSISLLIFTWPLMLLIALLIKLEDGIRAPVFYRQARVGRYDRVFEVLKFRSMSEDAESDGRAVWAEENDDRITRVGKWLRILRLDELPQVINVWRGEMSLVGPRPERPEFVEGLKQKIPYYSERHTVKPGVTGWAQLKYGYGASEEDAIQKLQYDLYYVKNHGLFLDLFIILQTVEVVLWGKGAR